MNDSTKKTTSLDCPNGKCEHQLAYHSAKGSCRYATCGCGHDQPPAFDCRICGKPADLTAYGEDGVRMTADRICFSCNFWQEYADKIGQPDQVVIDGHHYVIGREDKTPAFMRGYAGRLFVIQFDDGRNVSTTNLWHQGDIPAVWRSAMPDNAKFMEG